MTQLHNLHACRLLVAAVAAWIFGARLLRLLGQAGWRRRARPSEQCKAENAGKSAAVKAAPFVLSFIAEIVMAWRSPASWSTSASSPCAPA